MQPLLAASSFLLELCVRFYDCRERVLEQQPPLILVSILESSACPGGACIGIGSSVGPAPPLTVLLRSLQQQIVLSEPL